MVEVQAGFSCPLIGAENVVFLEVDTSAKPVVVLSAGLKRRTAQEFLSGFKSASVIGKN
jgi:hypothetical protein